MNPSPVIVLGEDQGPTTPPPRRRSWPLLLVTTLAAWLIVVVWPAEPMPTMTTGPLPRPSTATSLSSPLETVATVVPFTRDWQRLYLAGEGSLADIEHVGERWVAVGGSGHDPLMFVSRDANLWDKVEGLADGGLNAIAATANTTVAAGWSKAPEDDVARPAIWSSIDGEGWERFALDEPGGPGELVGVIIFGDRTFVWGRRATGAAQLWLVDRDHWSPVLGATAILDVFVFHDSLIAIGGNQDGPAVWASSDGIEWSLLPMHGLRGYPWSLRSVVARDSEDYLGLFTSGPGSAASQLWISENLVDWEPLHRISLSFGHLEQGGPGIVGLPSDPAVGDMWFSRDGSTWDVVPGPESGVGGSVGTAVSDHLVRDAATAGPTVAVGEHLGQPVLWTWGGGEPVVATSGASVWEPVLRVDKGDPLLAAPRWIAGNRLAFGVGGAVNWVTSDLGVFGAAIVPQSATISAFKVGHGGLGFVTVMAGESSLVWVANDTRGVVSWGSPWDGYLWSVTQIDGDLVAIGTATDERGGWRLGRSHQPNVWSMEEIEGPPALFPSWPLPISAFDGGFLARGADEEAWVSLDGSHWDEVAGDGPATVGASFVAHGSEVRFFPSDQVVEAPKAPVLDAVSFDGGYRLLTPGWFWFSFDGRSWQGSRLDVSTGFTGAYPFLLPFVDGPQVAAADHGELVFWQR